MPFRELVIFAAAAVAIYASGSRLPVLGKDIAARLGVSATTLGLFVLALITSLPELSITIAALARERAPDLALGNILGSNNFNIMTVAFLEFAFIGGGFLGAVHARRYTRTCRLLLILTLLVGGGVLAGRHLGPVFLPLVLFSLPIAVLFVVEAAGGGSPLEEEEPQDEHPVSDSTPALAVRFLLLAAVVVGAGFFMSSSANRIALFSFHLNGRSLVLGQTFVGSLLVAIATSLPEVTVAFAAVGRARSADMALGTLLGSNTINILLFALGAPLLMLGGGRSAWSGVAPVNLVNVVAALVLTSLALFGIRSGRAGGTILRQRILTGIMVPIYIVCLVVLRRLG